MHWGIYEKHKGKIIYFTIINFIIVAPVLFNMVTGKARTHSPTGRDRARLKQIATTVAMYYTDGGPTTYPKSPKTLDIDGSIINNAVQDTWFNLSYTSPYYFFPHEGSSYTGSAWRPIAVRKTPVNKYCNSSIVYENGRALEISPELARFLIFCSRVYKAIVFKENLIHNDF